MRKLSGRIYLRPYRSADAEGLAVLFYDTVHFVNSKDYTPEQLNAWAPGKMDMSQWDLRFLQHHSLMAIQGETPVGFADMDDSGYLDRLFVHKDHQGEGIATTLCDQLERVVAGRKFTTHASITARPFFERRGYQVVREQLVEVRGVSLKNFVMEKTYPSC